MTTNVTFYAIMEHPEYGEVEVDISAGVEPGQEQTWHQQGFGPEVELYDIKIDCCTELTPEESKKHEGEIVVFSKLPKEQQEKLEEQFNEAAITAAEEADEAAYERYLDSKSDRY
jgi:hypothetical protein